MLKRVWVRADRDTNEKWQNKWKLPSIRSIYNEEKSIQDTTGEKIYAVPSGVRE